MKIKYLQNGIPVLEKELSSTGITKADVAELDKFSEVEIVSLQFDFADGIKCGDTHELDRLTPHMIKQMTIILKP